MDNPYLPYPAKIKEIVVENEERDIKTFKVEFQNPRDRDGFTFLPGQFAELSVLGKGECPIGIASSPTENGFLLFTIKQMGAVTTDLHYSELGRAMGIRGPYGRPYPWELMQGKNVLIVGGGFAFTTLRATIKYILDARNRAHFKNVTTIYGARGPGELIYKSELKEWEKHSDMEMILTVDKGDGSWKGREGFVPVILKEVAPRSENCIALVCGPPIMLKFTMPVLNDLGFEPKDVFVSLEMRMKCGIGKCGHCNIGPKYVCRDGPVFSWEQLQHLPAEF